MGCEASAVALPLQGCGDARRQPAVRADAGEIRQTPPLNASFAEPLARTPPTPGRHRPATVMQRRGRLLLALALLLPLALLLAAAGLLALVPAREAIVPRTDALEMRDVERALQLARQHDPRRAIPGVVRVLRLSQHEAELLINHAAARVRPGRWALALGADRLQLRGSLRLPDNPLGNWVNVELQARQTPGLPQLEAVKVGPLPLPLPLVQWLLDLAIEHQGLGGWRAVGAVAVQQVRLLPRRIDIVYAWGPDAPARVLATLLPERERARLRVYAAHLAALAAAAPGAAPQPLAAVLPPMFELAKVRSAAGEDPALENRAALMVLGLVSNGVGLGTLLPERRAELAARPVRLTLAGRSDFPQHLLVSATLAAESGTPLADLIGLYKELADARTGSGFSFNDVAANRAGVRLGELAVGAPMQLQARLAAALHDEDLLPDVSDLPEFMNEADFRRRYGLPGSPAYQRMMSDIEGRLDATPLFQLRP